MPGIYGRIAQPGVKRPRVNQDQDNASYSKSITCPEEGGVLRMNRATEIFTLYGFMH